MPDCEFYDHYQTIFVTPDVKDIVLVPNEYDEGLSPVMYIKIVYIVPKAHF